jgi:chromosome partitioning protein
MFSFREKTPNLENPGERAKIITIANQKGGVGKTTTTMNLGASLARKGKRVLLIDSDPQANLTSYLGVTPGQGDYEDLRTLDEVYLAKRPLDAQGRSRLIAHTPSGVDLVAADRSLSGVEYYLFSRSDRELVLARFLAAVAPDYDVILMDTPPSLTLLTLNALCASDEVLIPVQTEFFSLEGIIKLRAALEDICNRWNPRLRVGGILPTQVSFRRKLTQEVLNTLKTEFPDLLFNTVIHDNSAVTESTGHAQSVFDYDRGSRGAKDYEAAAEELLNRWGYPKNKNSNRETPTRAATHETSEVKP